MFGGLPYPPADYHICPCCATEFGNDDAEFSHEQLREMWIGAGMQWFFGSPPPEWKPWAQLLDGLGMTVTIKAAPASHRRDAISLTAAPYELAS